MNKTVLMLAAGAALATTGCQSLNSAPTSPDELRVVKKAPLVVPPDYSLRPPQAGQAQPFEVDLSRAGVATAFGSNVGASASASERLLVANAGANAVNPIIRDQVDYEEARIIRKSSSITDRVMFWRQGGEEDTGGDSATGNEPVTIESSTSRSKLPGT